MVTKLDATDLRVLALVSEGWTAAAIATDLHLHRSTVTRRLKRCRVALEAPNRIAAVVAAIHRDLI